jgi:hypothetical protein
MNAVRTTIRVAPDGTISGHAPPGVPPGEHAVEIDVPGTSVPAADRAFPVMPMDYCGSWPEDFSLRREDLYGDDGR